MNTQDHSSDTENLLEQLTEVSVNDIFEKLKAIKPLAQGEKYWVGISGSWRKTNPEVEQAVRNAVTEIITRDGGIVTGGALNVDYFATSQALQVDHKAKHIKVILPVSLDLYAAHYRKRAQEGVITPQQAEKLIQQLSELKDLNPGALIEHPENKIVNKETYFQRNTEVVNASDALIGFQVNDSEGVADTLVKASQQGKPTSRISYQID